VVVKGRGAGGDRRGGEGEGGEVEVGRAVEQGKERKKRENGERGRREKQGKREKRRGRKMDGGREGGRRAKRNKEVSEEEAFVVGQMPIKSSVLTHGNREQGTGIPRSGTLRHCEGRCCRTLRAMCGSRTARKTSA